MKKINPNELFDENLMNYQVDTEHGKQRYVNLDNAATTPQFKKVRQDVQEYMAGYGSVHRGAGEKSKKSTDVYEESRGVIKEFVGARKDDYVIFTGNTTGAMNTAAHFYAHLPGRVAVSKIEHSSSWLPWVKAEGEKAMGSKQYDLEVMDKYNEQVQHLGAKKVLRYDVNDNFEFDLADIDRILKNDNIKVFVLTASSNVTGYCPPIKEIGEIVHKYGADYLVDGCQYIQHHKIDMQEMGIDMLAASGHKFYAPYGGGFLIGSKKFLDKFLPYQIGGGNLPYITKDGEFIRYFNQLAHDPGTPNALGAISMASAIKQLQEIGIENVEEYEKNLTEKAYEHMVKNPKVQLYTPKKHLSTVLPFNIDGKCPKDVAEILNTKFGIGTRAGSFCAYEVVRKLLKVRDESKIVSEVRKGITKNIPGFARASISLQNIEDDINRFNDAINYLTNSKIYNHSK